VFFHAHPDDEALLTAGTMAMLAAEGHRVVLVVATAGERGLAEMRPGEALGETRMKELYSGLSPQGGVADERPDNAFIDADSEKAAQALAAILEEEDADLLSIYDPAGGYGHPDHVQVHRVGKRAAQIAGTEIVLEATVNRDPLVKLLKMAGRVYRFPPEFDVRTFESAYSSSETITHRVNVRRFARQKRAAMAAHVSQASGGESDRTLAVMLKVPGPVYRLVFGTEWFVRRDLPPGTRLGHPFDRWPK
jgi:LmbE family N-acetylglucosaminyl deacetylase